MAWLEEVAPDLSQGWQRIALALSTVSLASEHFTSRCPALRQTC